MRFVVFAHARSGSTTLCRALELQPSLCILIEPFNETFTKWRPGAKDYRELVTDEVSLDHYLEEMYADHNGIKMLDYQMPRRIYAHLLREPSRRVIWLKRSNILQSVVSVLISEQTGVWHSWDLHAPVEERYADLGPLDIADIRKRIGDLRREIAFYDEVVASRGPGATHAVTYEELYLGSAQDRQRTLNEVFAFLGVDAPPGDETDRLMEPARTKLNSERTYAFLPNAEEIEATLGSDETGWLFPSRVGSAER